MTMLHSVGVRNAGNTVLLRCPRARTLCRPSTNSAMISQAFHSNMSVTHTERDFGDNVFEQNVKTAEMLNIKLLQVPFNLTVSMRRVYFISFGLCLRLLFWMQKVVTGTHGNWEGKRFGRRQTLLNRPSWYLALLCTNLSWGAS